MEITTMEDDLFFAELNKQISLLIMDDDDHDHLLAKYPSVSFQGFYKPIGYPTRPTTTQVMYDFQNQKRESSKGTGVFIPRSWQQQPKKKNKLQLRSNSSTYSNNTRAHNDIIINHNNNNNNKTTRIMVSHVKSCNDFLIPKKDMMIKDSTPSLV